MSGFGDVARSTLPSGVPVFVARVDSEVAAISASVRAGSRDEPPGALGATHMLEHLLLRRREAGDAISFVTEVDALGGEANALTAREELIAFCRVPADQAVAAMELLVRSVAEQPVPGEVFESERRVILEELRARASDPGEVAHDLLFETAFPGAGLGRPVPGTIESVSALRPSTVEALRRERVHAGTVGLVFVGPYDLEDVVARLGSTSLAELPTGEWAPVRTPPRFAAQRHGSPYARSVRSDYASVVLGAEGVPYAHRDRPAAEVLAVLLGGAASSLLYTELRDRLGLAYSIWANHRAYTDAGVLRIQVDADPRTVAEVVEVSRSLIAARVAEGWSERELSVARAQCAGQLLLECESAVDLALAIARNRHVGGLEGWTLARHRAAIAGVGADRLHELARTLLGGGIAAFVATDSEANEP